MQLEDVQLLIVQRFILLEITNDAYTTLSRNLIGCSTFSQDTSVLQDDWLILENNVKATLNINMPYCSLYVTHHDEDYLLWLVLAVLVLGPSS